MKFNFAHLGFGRTTAAVPAAPAATQPPQAAGTQPPAQAPAPAAQGAAPAPAATGAETPAPAAPAASTDAVAQARQDERTRCASIFAAPEAEGRVQLAAQLAFTTDLSAEQAVGILKASPAAAAPAATPANPFVAAMGSVPNPQVGADAEAGTGDDAQALVAQILKAGA
ncbi:hypothetical protein FZ983_17000 [Azospirillum sp. B21]|uniref:hypothetical protein n=1 Tax=Azospirillum sp. B21 TaxID=2607496 RepID=UPI0011F05920|nr:hypothetical protein [Azospirillum sp. B21]KAA0579022.1 hypothetical protein FZ983_17000 [Azospirillum sp. B21]